MQSCPSESRNAVSLEARGAAAAAAAASFAVRAAVAAESAASCTVDARSSRRGVDERGTRSVGRHGGALCGGSMRFRQASGGDARKRFAVRGAKTHSFEIITSDPQSESTAQAQASAARGESDGKLCRFCMFCKNLLQSALLQSALLVLPRVAVL